MRFRPLLLAASVSLSSLAGAQRQAEVIRPQMPVEIDASTRLTNKIFVKFLEGHRVRLDESGRLQCGSRNISSALEILGSRKIERMFTRDVDELDQEKADLERSSGETLADLNNYFYVETAGKQDSEALLNALLADANVETADAVFSEAGIVPLTMPDLPPTTPLFESRQTYFNAAPSGFGHLLTRSIDGAQGLGSQIVAQMEGSWVLGHEDAENLIRANVVGTTNFGSYGSSPTWIRHGTACFGLINANRNAYGVVGFAPLAQGKVSSLANGSSNMISLMTAQAKAGDVFTTSIAYLVSSRHAPLDWPQSNFDAIRRATAKGICYFYGSGNTGQDLTNSIYRGRYTATAPESGGFIIGATPARTTARISWSNYGPKVIANGWGAGVATIGYGSLFNVGGGTSDRRQNYTATFGGTSAAGPEVAGVIASLQGAHRRQNGSFLTPAQVRALLKIHGTAITGNIGLRPDLNKLMRATKALDGLSIRVEPQIGRTMSLVVEAARGRIYALLGSGQRASTAVGLNRPLLLDAAGLFVVGSGVLSSTSTNVNIPVPNVASLRGGSFFMQVADLNPGIHLTNSVEAWIR